MALSCLTLDIPDRALNLTSEVPTLVGLTFQQGETSSTSNTSMKNKNIIINVWRRIKMVQQKCLTGYFGRS